MNRWIESKNSIKHRNDFDIASQKITRHTFFILCYPCEIFHGLVHGKCALKWYYLSLLYVCFSHFLNCTNGTKSRKTNIDFLFYWKKARSPLEIFFEFRNCRQISLLALVNLTHITPLASFYTPWKQKTNRGYKKRLVARNGLSKLINR